jgi:hypothetical protein
LLFVAVHRADRGETQSFSIRPTYLQEPCGRVRGPPLRFVDDLSKAVANFRFGDPQTAVFGPIQRISRQAVLLRHIEITSRSEMVQSEDERRATVDKTRADQLLRFLQPKTRH